MRVAQTAASDERKELARRGAASVDSPEYLIDRRLRREAIQWAIDHPCQVVQLAGIKLLRMWNIWPNESHFSAWPVRLLAVFTYVPIAILGIIGVWRTVGRGWPYLMCWLPAVYLSLIHSIFVSSMRYREPAMLPWMVLAAVALWGRGGKPKD